MMEESFKEKCAKIANDVGGACDWPSIRRMLRDLRVPSDWQGPQKELKDAMKLIGQLEKTGAKKRAEKENELRFIIESRLPFSYDGWNRHRSSDQGGSLGPSTS
jgi:hypothetical protein